MRQAVGNAEGRQVRRRSSVRRQENKRRQQSIECPGALGIDGSDARGSGRTDQKHLGHHQG